MQERSPAFQFYPKDWLSSEKIMMMNNEQRGEYITMLCYDWINIGISEQAFNTCSTHVQQCFIKKGERYYNPRLVEERKKQADNREIKRLAGIASGEARRKQTGVQQALNRRGNRTRTEANSSSLSSSSSTSSSSSSIKEKELKDIAQSTRLREYYNAEFEKINGVPPEKPSKAEVVAVNAAVKKQVDSNPEKYTHDFYCGLVDYCFGKGVSVLKAMVSANWINSYLSKDASTKESQRLRQNIDAAEQFLGKG